MNNSNTLSAKSFPNYASTDLMYLNLGMYYPEYAYDYADPLRFENIYVHTNVEDIPWYIPFWSTPVSCLFQNLDTNIS